MTDPIERAKARAGKLYPDATISTRSHRGQPVVLAVEGDLIRLVRPVELTPSKKRAKPR